MGRGARRRSCTLGDDFDGPVADYKRRIGRWLLWRSGPATHADARYLAIAADDLDTTYTFRLFADGTGEGTGPSGAAAHAVPQLEGGPEGRMTTIEAPEGEEALTEFILFRDRVYEGRAARWPALTPLELPPLAGRGPLRRGSHLPPARGA